MVIDRLKEISVDDGIEFRYNNEVMNRCFGCSRGAEYGQYAVQDTGDGCYAWFPKERRMKNGEWYPGSSDVNWKNHIEEGGRIIVEELNEGEFTKDSSKEEPKAPSINSVPTYVFFKKDDGAYMYVGTFLADANASVPRRHIYRRISDKIDLSVWSEGINPDYIYGKGKPHPAYKNIYVDKNFKKHQQLINVFLESWENKKELEQLLIAKIHQFSDKYSLMNIGRMNESTFRTDYLPAVRKMCCEIYGAIEEDEDLEIDSMGFPEIAHQYVDIINISDGDHNRALRNSRFGGSLAGKIMTLYDPKFYIYGLPEDIVDYYIDKLRLDIPQTADLTEKQCLLYFWKQCNNVMHEWSPLMYYEFLIKSFGSPRNMELSLSEKSQKPYEIDELKLKAAMRWFVEYVVTKQGTSDIDFHTGYLYDEEGYKYDIFDSAQDVLELDAWDEEMIGDGIILDCVIEGFKAKDKSGQNNIVDFHSITKFQNRAEEDLERAEDILYRLFIGEDVSKAFDDACSFWGKWYPIFSYLLFIKDIDSFLPVKTDNHIRRLNLLGIKTDCLTECNWRNYTIFLEIMKEVRERLESYLGTKVNLLDAHSFVWMLHYTDEDFSIEVSEDINQIADDSDPFQSTVIIGQTEGKEVLHYVKTYERSPKNRAEAIRIHGLSCMACGFNFKQVYGEIGDGFIEVHHVKPLHTIDEEVAVNPETDLVCLCANCHRMIHSRRGSILSIEELKSIIINANS